MEEELRRPRPVPPAPPPATPSPHGSELLLSVSEEQLRLDGTVEPQVVGFDQQNSLDP
jgi:hypothetical protein